MKFKKIFISETTGQIGAKLCLVLWWPPFKIVSGNPDKVDDILFFFPLKTTGQIGAKRCLVFWWPPLKIVFGNPDIQPTWPLLLKTEKVDEILFVPLLNYWANWIQALLK